MNKQRVIYYLAGLVSLVTFVVYLPALWNDFVLWDDDLFIYNNLRIRSLDWNFFKWAFSDISVSHWRPLVWISHALDYSIWGMRPLGHHLTNVLLHAANTFIVVYLAIRLLDVSNRVRMKHDLPPLLTDQAILITGGVAGMLFGLHPLHVESVAWITERKDVLYSLFFLLSVSAYIRYVEIAAESAASQKEERAFFFNRHYLLSLAFFVLALSSKAMAVTLPFVLLILDWYPLKRMNCLKDFAAAFKEKLPFMTFSVSIAIVTVIAQKKSGAMSFDESVQLPERVLVAFKALIVYLWKMLAPVNLVPFYPYEKDISLASFAYSGSIVVVIGITVACIVIAKKRPLFLAIWGYYVVSLVPVLGIIRTGTYSMADRYTYLPSLGPFLAFGLFVAWGLAKVDLMKQRPSLIKLLVAVTAIFLFSGMSYLTVKQIAVWKNSLVLWSYVIEKEPDRVPIAYNNRGLAYKEIGQVERAIDDYNAAIRLAPADAKPYTNRGIVFGEIGQFEQAMEDFNAAIALNPKYADAYTSRGLVFEIRGQLEMAVEDYNTAIELKPLNMEAYLNRGVAFARMAQFDRAIKDYDRAISLNPYDYLTYSNRGIALSKSGQVTAAIKDFTSAIALNPRALDAYLVRGELFQKEGKHELALRDYQTACTMGSEAGCDALRSYREP